MKTPEVHSIIKLYNYTLEFAEISIFILYLSYSNQVKSCKGSELQMEYIYKKWDALRSIIEEL